MVILLGLYGNVSVLEYYYGLFVTVVARTVATT